MDSGRDAPTNGMATAGTRTPAGEVVLRELKWRTIAQFEGTTRVGANN